MARKPILADTIDLSRIKSAALRRLIEEVRRDADQVADGAEPLHAYNRTYHRHLPTVPGGYNRTYNRHNR